jgi:hypothetical protein
MVKVDDFYCDFSMFNITILLQEAALNVVLCLEQLRKDLMIDP